MARLLLVGDILADAYC